MNALDQMVLAGSFFCLQFSSHCNAHFEPEVTHLFTDACGCHGRQHDVSESWVECGVDTSCFVVSKQLGGPPEVPLETASSVLFLLRHTFF